MKAKLIVEGKEFNIEIQDPELQKLVTPKKKTGYERVYPGDDYFYIVDADVCTTDDITSSDEESYEVANYYSDSTVAKNNARADKLMRKLRRFAVEHKQDEIDWDDSDEKFVIVYNYGKLKLEVSVTYAYRSFGAIYFDLEDSARLAIETFHDELIWYFTEYKDSL